MAAIHGFTKEEYLQEIVSLEKYIEHIHPEDQDRYRSHIMDKMHEIELDRARDKANEASRAKTAFLASMSHEIRTPMNGVIGLAQLLDKTELDETQKKYVHDLLSSGRTMVSILNDVLDVSKIEKGMLELHLTDMELEVGLKPTITTFKEIAAEKYLSFKERYDIPKDLILLADETRLRQIVWNLLSNAIKFT
jgi:signal transduction histidine kinase